VAEISYNVSIEVVVQNCILDLEPLYELSESVMMGEAVANGTALAILLTDDDEIRSLNHQFLGIDEPTDVLSFPDQVDGDWVDGMDADPLLGDIAISVPTAERQAATVGHPLEAEMRHLVVHGILHLCGYDHVTGAEDEARMRAREEHYLGDLDAVHQH
jgi:probable rRNA maturation factor